MALTIVDGGLQRLINGFDSFGNVCDHVNPQKVKLLDYNGMNTTGKKFVK